MSESKPKNLSEKMYGTPEERAEREAPRRMNAATVLAMQHEERMAQITKPSRGNAPAYSLKRSTSSGSLGVVAIDVEVPVCELYPTGEEAIAHLIETFDTLRARYPMPDGYVRAK